MSTNQLQSTHKLQSEQQQHSESQVRLNTESGTSVEKNEYAVDETKTPQQSQKQLQYYNGNDVRVGKYDPRASKNMTGQQSPLKKDDSAKIMVGGYTTQVISKLNSNIQSTMDLQPKESEIMNELLREKDKQILQLKAMNEQLKDKVLKLSQALDMALISARQAQLPPTIQEYPQVQQQPQPPQREALVNHIKMKEKEANSYMGVISALKKENTSLKGKLENKQGFHRIVELEDKLKETQIRNAELQREVKSMQRIQLDQGKALERITNENDYPNRIKTLVEELRVAKDKIKDLEERTRREEKHSLQVQEYMIKLEETCRELKSRLKSKQSTNNEMSTIMSTIPDNVSTMVTDDKAFAPEQKIAELQKANSILLRAKEVQYKKGQYLKAKFEKRFAKIKVQMETLTNQLSEKDKEIKLYQMKLREFAKSNLNNLNSQTYLEIEQLTSPKPLPSNNRMADTYNKMKEISVKYGKLPLKPGFPGGVRTVRLQQLSIDVNGNDYGMNKSELGMLDVGGHNRNLSSISNSKSVSNRSKSIDPTTKRLARLPETTRKYKPEENLKTEVDDYKIDIVLNQSDIGMQNETSAFIKDLINEPSTYSLNDDPLGAKQRDLDRETEELLARIQQQNIDFMSNQDKVIDQGLDQDYMRLLDGNISKFNNEILDDNYE